jgi:hypothetical protein
MVCSDMLCRRFAAGSDPTTAPLGKPNGKVLLSLRDERFNGLCHEVATAPCRGLPAHGKAEPAPKSPRSGDRVEQENRLPYGWGKPCHAPRGRTRPNRTRGLLPPDAKIRFSVSPPVGCPSVMFRKTIPVWLICVATWSTATAQAPPAGTPAALPDPIAADENAAENADAKVAGEEVDAEQLAAVTRLVQQLGSASFADRERAASELMAMGVDTVDILITVVDQSTDAEIQLRGRRIIRQLKAGDLQTRIDDFLAGRDVKFDGWNVFRGLFGDNGELRQLFVDLVQSHPELIKAIEGTTRDRVVAMEKTVATVQQRMFVERKFPSPADTFALAMATIDDGVPVTAGYESVLLSTLQKTGANTIRTNALLAPPFEFMLGRVIPRTTLSSRVDMLLTGMSWDIPSTLTLAVATLGETEQADVIAVALQAIARFGEKEHALLLTDLLDDKRDATEAAFIEGQQVRTQVGDLAMVAIGILYDADLKELGMGDARPHPTYGFIIGDVGFPINDSGPRTKARQKIDKLLRGEPAS